MKKYVKPELFYEHFELTQHIAACGWEMQSGDATSCKAIADTDVWGEGYDQKLFLSDAIGCTITNWQDFCYENSADPNAVGFTS